MRLMNIETKKLEHFVEEAAPKYAILSHTWGDGEVSFQDLEKRDVSRMPGYIKIQYLCRQAALHGIMYVWIDTCCIDKTSSTELSEAINSMFKWYQKAHVCYAYLSDVLYPFDRDTPSPAFNRSRWFTRGWTLQELLAPTHVDFFGADWISLGTKESLRVPISKITGIPENVLRSPQMISCYSIAARMCWAAERVTTRIEDRAYSLLGLFDINMPLVYGEGTKAFIRLQEELVKVSDDETVLVHSDAGVLATDAVFFRTAQDIAPLRGKKNSRPYSMTNKGLHIELLLLTREFRPDERLGILNCHHAGDYTHYIAIPLGETGRPNVFSRLQVHDTKWVQVSVEEATKAERRSIYIATEVLTQNYATFCIQMGALPSLGYAPIAPIADRRIELGNAMLVWQPDLHAIQLISLVNTYIKFCLVFRHSQLHNAYAIYIRSCGLLGFPVEFGVASYQQQAGFTIGDWIDNIEEQIKSPGPMSLISQFRGQETPLQALFEPAFVYPPNSKDPRVRINEEGLVLRSQSSNNHEKSVELGGVRVTMNRQERLGEDVWVLDISHLAIGRPNWTYV